MRKWLIVPALFVLQWTVLAECPHGTVEYEGTCAALPTPADSQTQSTKPSDEKPPEDKMPSYQREGIHVDEVKYGVDLSSTVQNDPKGEREQR